MSLNKSRGNMENTDKACKAWMAGFIDGEGWIGMSKQKRENRPNPTYRTSVKISNQQIESLEVFKQYYDSQIKRYKDCYQWVCPERMLSRLLEDIIPFLILKKEQAKTLLEYKQYLDFWKNSGTRKTLGSEDLRVREICYLKCKELNKHRFREA